MQVDFHLHEGGEGGPRTAHVQVTDVAEVTCPNNLGTSFLQKKKPCGTQLAHKGLVKSFQSEKYVVHFTCYHFQLILRQIGRKFGTQLIRRPCKWFSTCMGGGEGGSTPMQVNLHHGDKRQSLSRPCLM